jgi:hypothetical protein
MKRPINHASPQAVARVNPVRGLPTAVSYRHFDTCLEHLESSASSREANSPLQGNEGNSGGATSYLEPAICSSVANKLSRGDRPCHCLRRAKKVLSTSPGVGSFKISSPALQHLLPKPPHHPTSPPQIAPPHQFSRAVLEDLLLSSILCRMQA